MSITDELREYATNDSLHYVSDYLAIADRIDAEHETTELQKESYRLDLKAANIAVGEAYKRGYDEGFVSADDWLAQHEGAIAEHGWVRLPVDTDGECIHIGDVLYGYGKSITVVSMRLEGFGWVLISEQGGGFHDCHAFTHYHAPTVEDVLREFAEGLGVPVADSYIAASAAKLQLKEDE